MQLCNLHRFGTGKRPLQSKCLACHLTRFSLLALHFELVCHRKEFIDLPLQCLAVFEAPLPLVCTLAELMPADHFILVRVPSCEETLILGFCYCRNFADGALIDCKTMHHLDEVVLADTFPSGCELPKYGPNLVLFPFGQCVL